MTRQLTYKKLKNHIGHPITVNDSAEWVYIWCKDCEEKIYMVRKDD
jgi:hypothetical protein